MEDGLPSGALGVIIEASLQDVLEVSGVARDSHEALLPCQERHREDARLVRAASRA